MIALGGCALRVPHVSDLGGLYNRAAQVDDADRNPVIVIPGVLGSKLVDGGSGRVVWGAFAGTYADPRSADGARLIALPMKEGTSLEDLRDEVEPDRVLDRVRVTLLGLRFEEQAYLQILSTLGVGGYRDEDLGRARAVRYAPGHFTCFQFPYDWRRDNAENARRLHEFILEKKAYVETELRRRYGVEREVRFDVIAHSMGGLLLRYYLRYGPHDLPADGSVPPVSWVGAKHVETAVLIGTPNAGSVEALVHLVEGVRFSVFLPRFPAPLLGTMPALYQLLPRTRHRAVVAAANPRGPAIDLFDPAEWVNRRWGLASPEAAETLEVLLPEVKAPRVRREIALDHLRKALARARQFHEALDVPASPPPGLSLHLFVGDSEPTPAVVEVEATGAVAVREHGPGDGTVLRTSAIMDERRVGEWRPGVSTPIDWTTIMFLFDDHLALTRDPVFIDNLLYRLLEAPRRRFARVAP